MSDADHDGGVTRRRFVAGGLGYGALGVASALGAGACGGSKSTRALPRRFVPTQSDLTGLAGRLRGRVIVPGSAGYDSARVVFNSVYDYVRPLAVVKAANADDLKRTIAFAQDRGIALVPRSGGHSFAGYSTGPGIVLDVSPMNSIQVDRAQRTVRVGAGGSMIQLLTQLGRINRAVPSGFCPTVGIAGLTMGGGIGRLCRKYGLTLDRLRRVELVSAAGQLLSATPVANPDLFWACRGGGGGNFGLVTELEFDLVPLDTPVTRFLLTWPWRDRFRAFAAWQQWSNDSRPEFQNEFTFSTTAPAGTEPSLAVEGTYLGSEQSAMPYLRRLEADAGPPQMRKVDQTDYVTAIKDVFCADISTQHCALESQGGGVSRFGIGIKSTFVNGTWPAASVEVISEWLERRQRDRRLVRAPANKNLGKIWFDSLGGAVASVPPNATAYVHRQATFCVQYQSRWSPDAPGAVQAANLEWLRGFHAAMRTWNNGAYVNYQDPDLDDFAHQYYGANLARLQDVKRRYDPHNFFNYPQSIRG